MLSKGRYIGQFYKHAVQHSPNHSNKLSNTERDFTSHRMMNVNICRTFFGGSTDRTPTEGKTSERNNFEKEINNLHDAYPIVKEHLLQTIPEKHARAHFEKSLDYNVPGGRMFRSLTMLRLYHSLKPEYVNDHEKRMEAYVVAWSMEIFNTFALLADDYTDQGQNRRGSICWYKKGDMNRKLALTDATMMLVSTIALIQRQCRGTPYLQNLNDCLIRFANETLSSFILEMKMKGVKKDDKCFQEFSYHYLAGMKASASVTLPIFSALYLAGYKEIPHQEILEKLCANISNYLQAQNDFQDTYEHGLHSVEIQFEDVRDGLLTWPLYTAFKYGTKEQRSVIENNYGRPDEECVQRIRDLYRELDISRKFEDYCRELNQEMKNDIDAIPDKILRDYFTYVVKQLDNYYAKPKLYTNN